MILKEEHVNVGQSIPERGNKLYGPKWISIYTIVGQYMQVKELERARIAS